MSIPRYTEALLKTNGKVKLLRASAFRELGFSILGIFSLRSGSERNRRALPGAETKAKATATKATFPPQAALGDFFISLISG